MSDLQIGDKVVIKPISCAIDVCYGVVASITPDDNGIDIVTVTTDATPDGYYVARRFELAKVTP